MFLSAVTLRAGNFNRGGVITSDPGPRDAKTYDEYGNKISNTSDGKIDREAHYGLDISVLPNAEVVSDVNGRVIEVGNEVVEIEELDDNGNPTGLVMIYRHLSTIGQKISPGAIVSADDIIGYYNPDGLNHVHIETERNSVKTDPRIKFMTEDDAIDPIVEEILIDGEMCEAGDGRLDSRLCVRRIEI